MANRVVFFGRELLINPVAFSLGDKPIYWYGIIIAIGFCIAIFYGYFEAKRTGLESDHIANVVLIGAPVAIVGARLYYVAFNFSQYKNNLWEIIEIWNGGLAIFGGLIAGGIAGFIYCKCAKVRFFELADIAVGGFFIGQSIGRWGNFMNCEAYGCETELPWKMGVVERGKLIFVHPTFLYESLWNAVGFLIMFAFRKKKKYHGQLFWFYLLWYGLGRVWIEGLRTDSLYIGMFRVSQLVAICCILTGGIMLVLQKHRSKVRKDRKNA